MDSDTADRSAIGVFATSAELVVRVWDDVMTSMTGIDASDAIGKNIRDLIPDAERRGLLNRFELVRDLGSTEVLAPALHKYLIPCAPTKASQRFDRMRQLVTISALRNKDGIDGLLVVVEDVTARMEQEKDLAEQLSDPDVAVRLRAAKGVSNRPDAMYFEEAEPAIHGLADKNWRVRRALADGIARRAAPEAVTALLEAVRNEHLDFGVLNSALQILQATSIDTTDTLLDFLRSDDHDLRMQSALALGQQNNKEAIRYLIDALSDDDPNVRYHVIEALGKLQAPEAVEPLLAIAVSRDFFLSFAALEALKQIGDTSAALPVKALLDDELLRGAAARTLGATGSIEDVEAITRLLNDGDLSVPEACEALCELCDRNAITELPNAVPTRLRKAIQENGISALAMALSGASQPTEKVIRVAGWIPSDEVREGLALLGEKDNLRPAAFTALSGHGETAIPFLLDALNSDDHAVRTDAARALASVDSPISTDALVSALRSDPGLAPAALDALAKAANPRAVDALIELLSSEDKTVRRGAVSTLRRIASTAEVSARLNGLLFDIDPNVREAALRVLGDSEAPEYRDVVKQYCSDSEELVRIAAVEQLAFFAPEDAISILATSLKDPAPGVRAAAAQSLAGFTEPEGTSALRDALEDPDAWVRYFAIRSLAARSGVIESRKLFQDLSENDPAAHVRVAAREAIDQMRA